MVFTGLLGATPNEDALASVLGHEVGHVVANHAGEKLSKVRGCGAGSQASSYRPRRPPLTRVVGVLSVAGRVVWYIKPYV